MEQTASFFGYDRLDGMHQGRRRRSGQDAVQADDRPHEPRRLFAVRAERDDGGEQGALPDDLQRVHRSATHSTRHCSQSDAEKRRSSHDRTRPKTTRQDALEHRRPTARGDERGRLPRLHAVVPVPALPLGQLRDGGEEGTGARTIPTRTRSATADGRRWRSGTRTTRTTWRRSRSRCAARCITSSSREHLWASIAHMARTQNGELLNTLQTGLQVHRERVLPEHLPGAVLGDQPRLGQARARRTPTATPSSARSSPRSPRDWRSSPPTSTRWAMPTNT